MLVLRMRLDVVINLLADAVENVDVAFFERGTAEDATEGAEEGIGVALVGTETDFGEGFAEMFQERFEFVNSGEVHRAYRDVSHAGDEDFVGIEHDGLGEVQCRMFRAAGDGGEFLAATQLGVAETAFLASEDKADPVILGEGSEFLGGVACRHGLGKLGAAFPVGGADEPVDAFGGLFPSRDFPGGFEQVASAVSHFDGFGFAFELGAVEDDEVVQPHRFHGARAGTDVAGDGGFDEDDGDVGEVAGWGKRERGFGLDFVGFAHDGLRRTSFQLVSSLL